ncbi:unnamed protein product, partial [Mesorhabditis belari]|uniref:Major facilitator superfamily (MFS) profile domain-containing protein n=1 Tax=Mesorhabditis belari TaxID=2138241 RepID=A0AAF3ER46_9BILA
MSGITFCITINRVNLGFATVCMVNSTAFDVNEKVKWEKNFTFQSDIKCGAESGEWAAKNGYNGTILWTLNQKSLVMSAGFYGVLVTTWWAGYLADRFGPKVIILIALFDYLITVTLSPFLASSTSYSIFFGNRVVMGLGEGLVLPTLSSLTSRWFAPAEKASMAAIFTSGNAIAAAVSPAVSSIFCSSFLGWPTIFYFSTLITLVLFVLWWIGITNTPLENRFVRVQERRYFENTDLLASTLPSNIKVPWSSILFSKVSMACYLCTFVDMFCVIIMQAFLPHYMKEVLHLPIKQNGFFTMLPFTCQLLTKNILAPIGDCLKKRNYFTHTTGVRIFQSISAFGAATALFLLAFLPDCQFPFRALPLLAMYGACYSTCTMGYFTSTLSIAPPFTGTMMSVSKVYGSVGQLIGTNFVSLLSSVISLGLKAETSDTCFFWSINVDEAPSMSIWYQALSPGESARVSLFDESGKQLLQISGAQGRKEKFSLTTSGMYRLCVTGEQRGGTRVWLAAYLLDAKWTPLSDLIKIENQKQTAFETITVFDKQTRVIHQTLKEVEDLLTQRTALELKHRSLVETNFESLNSLALLVLVCIPIIGFIQVFVLRSFFTENLQLNRFFRKRTSRI